MKTPATWSGPPTILRAAAIALLAAMVAAGCSSGPQAAAVDAPKARDALKAALDVWKKGEAPATLKSGSPAITVQDMDWESGLRLVDYEISGDGKDDDANLRIPVTLRLADAKGKEVRKNVTYVVGTSPAVTVFRELFR